MASSELAVSHSESSAVTATVDPITASSSLKRKRPPMIEIPNVLQEIKTEKVRDFTPENDAICFSGIGVGVSASKGKKKFMEDTHKIVSCLQGNNSKKGFFGVYDGHGGKKAADFVADNLHNNILEMMEVHTEIEEAVKAGYLKTDQEFLKQGLGSGTCCVTALIEGQEVVISNLGDCRAVLCRGGVAEALTLDHTAEQEDERKRIENEGGYVEFHRGAWRVHGVLSVSRSIGDAHLKDWVLAEPETKILQLTPDRISCIGFGWTVGRGLCDLSRYAGSGVGMAYVGNQEAIDTVTRLCSVQKKLGPSGDLLKDNEEDYGCVSVSPSSKLRRISLVKQLKGTQSPGYKKTVNSWKESEKTSRVKMRAPHRSQEEISLVKRVNMKNESPIKETQSGYKKTDNSWKDSENDFASENESPPLKSRKISLVKRVNMKNESPIKDPQSPGYKKTVNSWKDSENDFPSENESPPSKSRRISLVKRVNTKIQPASGDWWLLARSL
ncbi:hypothetical protein Pyn_10516 [Prunus yedoensis var. nudiflora]|uniref:protein-serine/threonine phosphatase n=1 Tax=Prunus yedoensis var. nudiflora TaxID=2094558 RepID=A0A314XXP1_PRUYE|nr:hypothetical protein Pyn_10516 [Prunus yedoensis var. nudiflora]